MIGVTATMTMVRAPTTLTLPAPDGGTIQRTPIMVQARARTAGGDILVDDKGISRYELAFDVTLTTAQAALLDTFYRTIAVGGVNAFTFTDHEGQVYTSARFIMDGLQMPKLTNGRYRASFLLDVPSLWGA